MIRKYIKAIIKLLKNVIKLGEDSDKAAIMAFYFLISIFPAIYLFIQASTYVYFNTSNVELASAWYSEVPESLRKVFVTVVKETKDTQNEGVYIVGILLALWTTTNGVGSIIGQLNKVYEVEESRSFISRKMNEIKITLLFILLIYGTSLSSVISSTSLDFLNKYSFLDISNNFIVYILKYLIMLLVPIGFFAIVYSTGPNIKLKFKKILPGALFGSLTFILTTQAFALYISNIADYSATYGSLGAVIALITWLYIAGYTIILGARVNIYRN